MGKEASEGGADAHPATTLDGAAFLFAHSAPDTGVLTGLKRPLEALVGRGTAPADRLGLLDLQQGRTGRPDREEQLRVLIAAGSTVAPVHGGNTPWLVDRWRCDVSIRLAMPLPSETLGNQQRVIRQRSRNAVRL